MILQPIHCIHCHGTDIVKFGKTPEGKQRYKCREDACNGRTFILNYSHLGRLRGTKQQIIDMAMNGSGVRDTARVLHVSPNTVTRELKKRIYVTASKPVSVKATEARAD
jgi:transposase-like protein